MWLFCGCRLRYAVGMHTDPQLLYTAGLQALVHGEYPLALQRLADAYHARRGLAWAQQPDAARWPEPARWPAPTRVTLPKLRHDAEQLAYLIAGGALPSDPFAAGQAAFEYVHAELVAQGLAGEREAVALSPAQGEQLRGWLGRHWYAEPLQLSEPILNPQLDYAALEAMYQHQPPGLAVMDQILSPANRAALWRYFQGASIFHDYWRGGYVGAYLEDGCHGPWLAQLTQALQQAFPNTLGRFPLHACWAYKYDPAHPGIGPHADAQAEMLWSVWLTPDEANLQPERSGLNIFALSVPPDFSGRQTADPAFIATLQRTPFVQVPYRCNRALLFYGGLIHSSDQLFFKPDYLSRRINLTLVFGVRPLPPEAQTQHVLSRPLLPVCR